MRSFYLIWKLCLPSITIPHIQNLFSDRTTGMLFSLQLSHFFYSSVSGEMGGSCLTLIRKHYRTSHALCRKLFQLLLLFFFFNPNSSFVFLSSEKAQGGFARLIRPECALDASNSLGTLRRGV